MKTPIAILFMLTLIPAGFAKDKEPADSQDPVVWGAMSHTSSCVIFKESRKTSGMFWGVAVTAKTYGVLEVIETQNYTLEQKKWMENQEDLNELQRLVAKDMVKFIKIPDKYSSDQLEKARNLCKEAPAPKKPTRGS
jgi:hypothetical protein